MAAAGHRSAVIADALGVARETARRYARASSCASYAAPVIRPKSRLCQPWAARASSTPTWTLEGVVAALARLARETGRPLAFTEWEPCEPRLIEPLAARVPTLAEHG